MEQLELVKVEDEPISMRVGRPQTLDEATNMFMNLDFIKGQTDIAQGYILRVVKDDCLYQEAGYVDIYSYAKGVLGFKNDGTINRCMNINKRFSEGGYSPFIANEYKYYKYSALQEIWRMSDDEIEAAGITETTTVVKIREIKKELKEDEAPADEQIEGQMNITEMIENPVATSQEILDQRAERQNSIKSGELEVLTDFAKEYYTYYMDRKQHELFETGKGDELISYTKESMLLLFENRDQVLTFSISTGDIEVSPDGYVKLYDGVVRKWNTIYARLNVLKCLKTLPEQHYSNKVFEIGNGVTPFVALIKELATSATDEIKADGKEIPSDLTQITKLLSEFYDTTYICCKVGFNTYTADLSGTEDIFKVSRLNKNGQPEVRDIFEIKVFDIAMKIYLDLKEDNCDGNCFYCNNESCNSHQEKRENCTYDHTKPCNMYKTHEMALERGINCTSDCCYRCKEKCELSCRYSRGIEKKSDWQKGVFEDDKGSYGHFRSEMVKALFRYLSEKDVEIDEIDGEPIKVSAYTRYVFFDDDKEYIEFLEADLNGKDKIDFKVSIERIKKEYEEFKSSKQQWIDEFEDVKDEIAMDIIEGIIEEEVEVRKILENKDHFIKYMHENFDNNACMDFYYRDKVYILSTEPGEEDLYFVETDIEGTKTGRTNIINLSVFVTYAMNKFVEDYLEEFKEKIDSKETEEIVEAEVISNENNHISFNIDISDYDTVPDEEKIEKCFKYIKEELINLPEDKSRKAVQFASDFIRFANKLISISKKPNTAAVETTVKVYSDTLKDQKELPILKNNDQRKAWLEDYESWPLWIDNQETQEKYYKYIFENGDYFVIRKAYSTRAHWDYEQRKNIVKPYWGHQKEYIVKKDANLTIADSETNTSMMVEYLKNLQRK